MPPSAQLPAAARVVAVIPARGGSRGVPLKNLEPVGGVPLVTRAVSACRATPAIDEVVISTDHDGIASAAVAAGALVVRRPQALAGHEASSESAVLHALDELAGLGIDPEVTLLVQCTSPFVDPADLDAAVEQVLAGGADSVFAAVDSHAFLWRHGPDGMVGVNHDPAHRPRRQDREPELRETGAFYVMRTRGFRSGGHRFFGRVAARSVAPLHAVEIDESADLALARALAATVDLRGDRRAPGTADLLSAAPVSVPDPGPSGPGPSGPGPSGPRPTGRSGTPVVDVDAVVTDFDGVHTDDHAYLDQDGRETVRVSREDGLGVARAVAAGVRVLILSTEANPVVAARARKLGIPVIHGVGDKAAALRSWIRDEGLDPARVAYLGNDVNDLGCLEAVGWPVAVAQAEPRVLAAARWVLRCRGGDGAVRELCELVLGARRRAAPRLTRV